jgi:hypothetical protein
MNDLVTPDSPVVIPESIIVHPEGEIRRGLYYYVVTAVDENSVESIPSHIMQVYAPNKENSIEFEWKLNNTTDEYRIYKGTVLGHYDGYVTSFQYTSGKNGDKGWIVDDGTWVLNENVCL